MQRAAELSEFVTGSEPLILLEALLRSLNFYLRHPSLPLNRRGPVWDTVEMVHPSLLEVVVFRE